MSGTGSSPAKRLLDEFGRVHLFSSWKYRSQEETNISSPPITAPLYGSNLEIHRMSKNARPDFHESDKRSSSPLISRNFLPPGDPHTGNYVKSEIRAETRDSVKEGIMNVIDGECARDLKEEHRGLCKDLRKECSVSDNKGETDANMKDINQELEGRNAPSISESSAGNNSLFRKEFKEYNRGSSYVENNSGGLESWYIPRPVVQPQADVRKDNVICEKEWQESHEAVGDNKIELKGEDKLKEKDRKRKDVKHLDLGEKDSERSDHGNFQFGNSCVEFVDSVMENMDGDKWERARKYLIKDKEKKPKDKDSGNPKIVLGANNFENDSSHYHGKGGVQSSIRKQEHHETDKEPLKQKDFDGLKNLDKDVRARKHEKDVDVEGDNMEVQTAINEKEIEDGIMHVDNNIGKEKDAFPYEIQQRKRMVRTRGSSQPINRELRMRSHSLEVDGLQGKTEMSVVVYKVGECMHELEKLWKDYECSQNWVNGDCTQGGPTLAIRILAEHITATNRQVRGGQLWGTDVYTDDSDLVAVLMHTGYCRPTASPPPHNVLELYTTIKVLAPQDCYISTLRNNVRSRAWGSAICCSYRVESCCIVLRDGGKINLEPCLTHTSTVEPTLAPVVVERSMTTRAAASNALRQQRFVREVTIQYNLCNEPWIKYSISIVADKGLKKPLYTSARLKKGDVLYLETPSCRYELCFSCEKIIKASASSHEMDVDGRYIHDSHNSNDDNKMDGENMVVDVFRWSWCKTPIPQKLMQEIGIPLPSEHVEVLADNVEWENVQWSQTGVWVAGREYTISRVHFLSPL